MVTTKMVLCAVGLCLSLLGNQPFVYAKHHHTPQFTLQPAGYCYETGYQIRLLSHPHTRPLKVAIGIGRYSPYLLPPGIKSVTHMQREHYGPLDEKNFTGRLSFTIDNKDAHIAFEKDKQQKLQWKTENILTTSLWYKPLYKILKNIWRCDRDSRRKWERLGLPHPHISTPFSIRIDFNIGFFHQFDATYVLRSREKPFSSRTGMRIYTLIRPIRDKHNKIRYTQALAKFYPYKDREHCLVCYHVTKKGLRKKSVADVKKGDTYLEKIATKALEKSAKLYFRIKQAEEKFCRIDKNINK